MSNWSGWKKHTGYDCPVVGATKVKVRFKSGITADYECAGDWFWGPHSNPDHSISHYQVKQEQS